MGPCGDRSTAEKNQAGHGHTAGPGRRARHPRRRACLLKGCERRFRPVHPLTRYCSQECRKQARQWRAWKARHRYRQSEAGKQKRRAQSRGPGRASQSGASCEEKPPRHRRALCCLRFVLRAVRRCDNTLFASAQYRLLPRRSVVCAEVHLDNFWHDLR